MTYIHYINYRGGVNNLCVAIDSKTGVAATSTKGKERAVYNLRRKMRRKKPGTPPSITPGASVG